MSGLENASVSAGLTADVTVYDFDDVDRDGDFSETIGTGRVPLQLEVNWSSTGKATSSIKCGLDEEGNRLVRRHSKSNANVTGAINGWDLTGSGEVFDNDRWTIYKIGDLENPC